MATASSNQMRKEWSKEKEGVILKFRDFKGFGFGYRFRALINSSFDGSNFGPKIMGYPFLLKIALKASWISCRPFQLTKMFLVYDEKLGSEITICMGFYNPKYVNVLGVFFCWKLRVSGDTSWKRNISEVSFRIGFFSSNCSNYIFIVSNNQPLNATKKTCWKYESNIYSHIMDFYTHLSSNNW
jgi:hypothetical protein